MPSTYSSIASKGKGELQVSTHTINLLYFYNFNKVSIHFVKDCSHSFVHITTAFLFLILNSSSCFIWNESSTNLSPLFDVKLSDWFYGWLTKIQKENIDKKSRTLIKEIYLMVETVCCLESNFYSPQSIRKICLLRMALVSILLNIS